MSQNNLKKININDLAIGMFVHAIADQKGNLSVKSQGHVKSKNIIQTLKQRGVSELIIDLSKQILQEAPLEQVPEPEPSSPVPSSVSFSMEIDKAKQLHKHGKTLQKTLLDSVKRGLPFDEHIPKEFAKEMVSSIDRNADALLCLTKIREKDDYLLEHSLNVAILLANFGKYLGMPTNEVEDLFHAGFLHDIGKIQIPDEILHKPGRLTDDEMEIMKQHVVFGVDTLQEAGIDEELIRTVSEHHERLDGMGYPFGKKAEQISRSGRMIAIADVYDALTADRVYKKGMPGQKALQILLKDCPVKYDHELLQHFIKSLGIYPVGTLVKLTNERIAMVIEQNQASPLRPMVKVIYSTRGNHYIDAKDLNLTESTVRIEKPVVAHEYKIDVNEVFQRYVLP